MTQWFGFWASGHTLWITCANAYMDYLGSGRTWASVLLLGHPHQRAQELQTNVLPQGS